MTADRIRRALTLANGALFCALGLWLMLDPLAVQGLYGMTLPAPMAISETRAIFGGMMAGIGAAILVLDLVLKCSREASVISAVVIGGLVLSRIVGFLNEGMPSGPVLNETIFEVAVLMMLTATGTFRRRS